MTRNVEEVGDPNTARFVCWRYFVVFQYPSRAGPLAHGKCNRIAALSIHVS
jgi:hypothetical protein